MSETFAIRLMGRSIRIACPPEEYESLQAAAAYLDQRMSEFAAQTGSRGEQLATMAALNLAHEVLKLQHNAQPNAAVQQRIEAMAARLDTVLAPPTLF